MRSGSWAITHRRGGHSGDPAQRPGGIRRVHEEGTGVGEVERPATLVTSNSWTSPATTSTLPAPRTASTDRPRSTVASLKSNPDDRPARAYQLG